MQRFRAGWVRTLYGFSFCNEQPPLRYAISKDHGRLAWGQTTLRLWDPVICRLHLGGTIAREDCEILNPTSDNWVDRIGKIEILSRFNGNTFATICSSHVFKNQGCQLTLPAVLGNWHGVLAP